MKSLLFIGGPLIATIGFGFYSGLLDFTYKHEGLEHKAGVPLGGTFEMRHEETYQCDENGDNCVLVDTNTEVRESSTEFSEIEGLEIEQEAIEYRESDEITTVRKQPGIAKYTDIIMRRPSGFDWKSLKFTFEREAALQEVRDEYDEKQKEMQAEAEAEGEMIQIDPPKTVIPFR